MYTDLIQRYNLTTYTLECMGCAELVQHLHMIRDDLDEGNTKTLQLCDKCFKLYNLHVMTDIIHKFNMKD